jgi:hypothetical protein
VRPTDENQPGSKRPNLMSSSRRANGEISILAMLDGQSRRSLSRRWLHIPLLPALLGYAAAGTAACALVGLLAWLAHERMDGPAGKQPAAVALAGKAMTVARAPAVPADAEADTATPGEPAPAAASIDAPLPAGGAAIVDTPPPDLPAPAMHAASDTPAAQAKQSTQPTRTARVAPAARPAPLPFATPTFPSIAADVAAPATVRSAPPKSVIVRPLATYRPAPPPPRTGTPAKPRRNALPLKPAAPAVDMDVALITAIIQHASRPLDAAGVDHPDASCAGKACGPRMPEQP